MRPSYPPLEGLLGVDGGGSAVADEAESAALILFGTARSSKAFGENESNQLGMVTGRRAGS